MEGMVTLQLLDAESGRVFSLKVTPAVAEKAHMDMVFATNLMKSVRAQEDPVCETRGPDHRPPLERGDGSMATTATQPAARVVSGVDEDLDDEPPLVNQARGEISFDDTFRWTHEAILLLVQTFKEEEPMLSSGKTSAKKVWERLADALRANGVAVTGPQCKSKINGLKKTYRSIKDHNNRSGNSRRNWVYLELMDSFFEKEPWMAPVRAVDTAHIEFSSSPSSGSSSGRRRRPSADSVLQSLQASREQRAAMHAEAMAKQDRLFNFLSGLKKQ